MSSGIMTFTDVLADSTEIEGTGRNIPSVDVNLSNDMRLRRFVHVFGMTSIDRITSVDVNALHDILILRNG